MSSLEYNYKLLIAYDGTQYGGWQIQPNASSIQELVQKALFTMLSHEVKVIGSGRTDAGVHATGQVAHFICAKDIDLYRFIASINGLLPRDIRVLQIERVPLNFHAQRSAVRKTYHYHLSLGRVQSPFRRLYSAHIREKIDMDLLKRSAVLFLGTHDFISFANEAYKGTASYDSIRTLESLDVIEENGEVCLKFTGNGFLYKMVRNIVGTLLDIGHGKMNMADIPQILIARDRRLAGQGAPPHGLFLVNVEYDKRSLVW